MTRGLNQNNEHLGIDDNRCLWTNETPSGQPGKSGFGALKLPELTSIEPAVCLNDIRYKYLPSVGSNDVYGKILTDSLIDAASLTLVDVAPDARNFAGDFTSYHPDQKHWSSDRAALPAILFEIKSQHRIQRIRST
jgi:hypothetical protein